MKRTLPEITNVYKTLPLNFMPQGQYYPYLKINGVYRINYKRVSTDYREAVAVACYAAQDKDDSTEYGFCTIDGDTICYYDDEGLSQAVDAHFEAQSERQINRMFEDAGWMDIFEAEDRKHYGY